MSNILSHTKKVKVFDTENWFQEWGHFCDKSDHVIQKPLELVYERCLKGFGADGQISPKMLLKEV